MKNELERLVKISDSLDKAGKFDEADLLDQVIQKIAGDVIDLDKYRKHKQEGDKVKREEIKGELIPVKEFLIEALNEMLMESTISIQLNEDLKSNFHEIEDFLTKIKQNNSDIELTNSIDELFAKIQESLNLISDSIEAHRGLDRIREGLNKAAEGVEHILAEEEGDYDV